MECTLFASSSTKASSASRGQQSQNQVGILWFKGQWTHNRNVRSATSILWINGLNNQNGICPVLKKIEIFRVYYINSPKHWQLSLCTKQHWSSGTVSAMGAYSGSVSPFHWAFPVHTQIPSFSKARQEQDKLLPFARPLAATVPSSSLFAHEVPTGQAPATLHLGAHHTPLAASTLPSSETLPQVKPYSFPPGSPAGAACPSPNPLMCVQMLGFLMHQVQNSFLFFVFSL